MNLKPGILLATLFAGALATAAPLKTDPANSSVSALFKQMNVPVEAKFTRFAAQIDYDAAHPDASRRGSTSTRPASTWAKRT